MGPNPREESCYMAAQIVVDSSSRILSIVAGYNGSKPNSCILKSSSLYKDIEGKCLLNSQPTDVNDVSIPQYLVGDGGYPLLPWLLVPFVNPLNDSSKENFNSVIRLMRVPVLRTIASLKNWGVLSRGVDAEFKTAVAYVGACSILHNALLLREDYTSLCDELSDSSCYDERSHYHMDTSLEEDVTEKKASVIRSALATVARNSTNA